MDSRQRAAIQLGDALGRKYLDRTRWDGDCVRWTGSKVGDGYGILYHEGKSSYVHRLLLGLEVGSGTYGDHSCRNKWCVNPDHLRVVTNMQNAQNVPSTSTRNVTGYRGVYPNPGCSSFTARVMHAGVMHYAGYSYQSAEEAHVAVVELRNRLLTHNDDDRNTHEEEENELA